MTAQAFLSLIAAAMTLTLALVVLWRDRSSFANRAFILGMLVLAATEAVGARAAQAFLPAEILRWHRIRLSVEALLPGTWLLFSLTFARTNYREFLKRWRWAVLAAFAFPTLLVGAWGNSLIAGAFLNESGQLVLPLGWSGSLLHIAFLLSAVLILMNLESTLRASTGTSRWQIKFMLLGLGALFAVLIFTSSQTLLYSSINTTLLLVASVALLVADFLILAWFARSRMIRVDVYPSQTFLYNSLTVLFVGVYLLAIGGLAKVVSVLGGAHTLPLATFVVFLALVVLATVLLSGELQQKSKRFISRHLRRPKYDYRNVWSTFTQRTGSLISIRAVCSAIARVVSETFGVPSVTLWLLKETQDELTLGGSTALSEEQSTTLLSSREGGRALIQVMRNHERPVDLANRLMADSLRSDTAAERFLRDTDVRYCVPLIGGGELLGLLALNDRVTKDPLTLEDFELLKTISDQAASALLNIKLSDRLLQAKEMEAFQTLSTFFIHDLKNLASRLSLTLQNLPLHYDNPAFREDLLKVISQSVERIDSMCGRLSPLSRQLELELAETDVDVLIQSTLASLNGSLRARLVQDLQPLPKIPLDLEEMQKVLINLVLNANDAIRENGEIRVEVRERNGWAILSVSDNGCGMSQEYIANSLFKPFHTTKKQGLGIGLFHSKKIVEAHGGRIEVESQEGRGSTFRVMLPENAEAQPTSESRA